MLVSNMLNWKWYTGNLKWLHANTIFLTRAGSHSYGTNIETSDEDFRGVAVPPTKYLHGFLHKFEQADQRDPDVTIFDVRKFVSLAANCNPNIIELLYADEADWVVATSRWEVLHRSRDQFLSQRAKHSFSGYAVSQLMRIKTHRRWLLDPPKGKPDRSTFGLPNETTVPRDQMGVLEACIKKVEDQLGGRGFTRDRVEGVDEELVRQAVAGTDVSPNLIPIVVAERRYGSAMRNWRQYETWRQERNPARAELERKHGYDTKHAMHLVRLMRMAGEIAAGRVVVKRPDADELRAIRAGVWTFDQLASWAQETEASLEAAWATTKLPKEPNREALDGLACGVVELFHGMPYMGPR